MQARQLRLPGHGGIAACPRHAPRGLPAHRTHDHRLLPPGRREPPPRPARGAACHSRRSTAEQVDAFIAEREASRGQKRIPPIFLAAAAYSTYAPVSAVTVRARGGPSGRHLGRPGGGRPGDPAVSEAARTPSSPGARFPRERAAAPPRSPGGARWPLKPIRSSRRSPGPSSAPGSPISCAGGATSSSAMLPAGLRERFSSRDGAYLVRRGRRVAARTGPSPAASRRRAAWTSARSTPPGGATRSAASWPTCPAPPGTCGSCCRRRRCSCGRCTCPSRPRRRFATPSGSTSTA